MTATKPTLARAYGPPLCAVRFKSEPQDFRVFELLPFAADGDGNHWLVHIEKIDINTLTMLDEVAKSFRVRRNTLGYSGLKDRFAISHQWISVPAQDLSRDTILAAGTTQWRVLDCVAHRRKLRVGSHKHNQFEIVLRDIDRNPDVRQTIDARLQLIGKQGVPNYFGPQRFGRDGSNLRRALQMFGESRTLARQQHRFAVSAARSMLFNAVLSARVTLHCWQSFVDGDLVMLNGSHSIFELERLGDDGPARLAAHDIHPSGPMWGKALPASKARAAEIETAVAGEFAVVAEGLSELGLKQERRALRLSVTDLQHHWTADDLHVGFVLSTGGFATSVLRELFEHAELKFEFPPAILQMLDQSAIST